MTVSKRVRAAACGVLVMAMIGCGGTTGDGAPAGNSGGGGGGGGGGSPDAGSGGSSSPQAFKMSGLVVDTQGHPLPAAQLAVCDPVYFNSCITGASATDGRYSIALPPENVWYAPSNAAAVPLLVGTQFGPGTYGSSATVDFNPPVPGTCTLDPEARIYVAFQ
jgi:hypothetical protein